MNDSDLREQLENLHQASFGWAMSCCSRDKSEAEAVLQTVYLKVLEGKARFDGRSSFKTWLFSVIRKTAAGHRRSNMFRRLRLVAYDATKDYVDAEDAPDEKVYRSQLQEVFRDALIGLPKRQREVLQLVFYHDFTLAEAAEIMGVSIGSVRTHYDRGKKRLRRRFEESRMFDESGFAGKQNQEIIP